MFPENRLLELLIIGALALIVVGPKDLPILMRRVGQFVGKMRGMAAEFRASFDELARQSELEELRKEVEALRSSHDTAIGQIHGALEQPLGLAAHDEMTPSYGMPFSPATPMTALVEAEPSAVVEAAPALAPKPPRKPKAAAATKTAPKTAAKTPAKPRTRAAKAAGEGS